ncbi:unnamed protein product [Rhodiola kirilowii]
MPRPGPRPYECVRRAWHSERHQPIRGSLIQEIFRVVTEIHCSATKRNKEWQEKLPIVVLKAEEIMYSKANSEAEYMDLKTLWDRANDAIDTIIRRDDCVETGDLIQPCIEAALHLGCIPRKASRSQRNNDPRCYLSPNPQERMYSDSDVIKRSALSLPDAAPDNISFKYFPFPFPPQTNFTQLLAPETCTGLIHQHCTYPLYYSSCSQGDDPQLCCNSLTTNTDTYATNKIHPMRDMGTPKMPESARISGMPQTQTTPPIKCDLALRLGPCWGSEDISDQSKNPKSKELHFFTQECATRTLNMDESSGKRTNAT